MGGDDIKSWTDEELMEAYQEGYEESFAELYQRYSNRLYGYLAKRCPSQQTTDDVFQITFQKLHAYRHRYDSKYPFSAWLFTICRNTLYDQLRKKDRSREDTTTNYEQILSSTSSVNTYHNQPTTDLDGLSEKQKRAIELRYYEDLPFEEIAQRLKTSPMNVRQMVSRGLKKLRKLLSDDS